MRSGFLAVLVSVASACGDNATAVGDAGPPPVWSGAEVLSRVACSGAGTAPDQIAVDDHAVYWAGDCGPSADTLSGTLYRAPLTGGDAVALAGPDPQWCVHGVLLEADRVDFSTGCGATLESVPKSGGTPTVVFQSDGDDCVHDLTRSSTTLFARTSSGAASAPLGSDSATFDEKLEVDGGGFAADPTMGGAPFTIQTDNTFETLVALDSEVPLVNLASDDPTAGSFLRSGLAVSTRFIAYSVGGNLIAIDRTDSSSHTVAPVTGAAISIRIDGDDVFWLDDDGLGRASLTAGGATSLSSFTGKLAGRPTLTTDASRVYWTDGCGALAIAK